MKYWIEVDKLGKEAAEHFLEGYGPLMTDITTTDRAEFEVNENVSIEWVKLRQGRKLIGMRKFPRPIVMLPGDLFCVTYRLTISRLGARVEFLG
jgi:hypothetical protein